MSRQKQMATEPTMLANGTKDIEARRELRDLARDLEDEADKIEGEEMAGSIRIGRPNDDRLAR